MIIRSQNKFDIIINKVLFFVFIFCTSSISYSQDLYDLEHSLQYADYLYSAKRFDSAAEEFERLVFLDPKNQETKFKLIRSERMFGDYDMALANISKFYQDNLLSIPENIASEYLYINLKKGNFTQINEQLAHNPNINSGLKSKYEIGTKLISKNYKTAQQICTNFKDSQNSTTSDFCDLSKAASAIKFKSPILASGMSTLIPGLGKVYTKNYSDAIIALLFVGTNAWQSYRGFKKNGLKSTSGWIFGSLATGFYIGNIYGSAKAAKRYNKLKSDEINNKVFGLLSNLDY